MEGDLSERARKRAAELADDAEVRVMAPKTIICPPQGSGTEATVTRPLPNGEHNDRRLPGPGSAIVREYKGQTLRVVVLADGQGFEWNGARHRTLTDTDVEDADPDRPAFELDHVLADGFAFTGHDTMMVERVDVTRLLVFPRVEGFNVEGLQLRFRRGTPWSKIIERLDQMLSSIDLTRAQVTVEEIWIRAQCVGNGNRRGRTIPIDVTPRASSLKSIEEDDLRVIGEKCVSACIRQAILRIRYARWRVRES